MDPIAAARYGMMVAAQRFESAAGRVAVGVSDQPAAVEAVADQLQAKSQFQAQIGTLRIADEMWRALIGLQARDNA